LTWPSSCSAQFLFIGLSGDVEQMTFFGDEILPRVRDRERHEAAIATGQGRTAMRLLFTYGHRPLLAYGDVSTLSLHATKLVHAIEGGAVMSTAHKIAGKVRRLRNFGIGPGGALPAGTNARMSELHAAVGALVLREANAEISRRSAVRELYRQALRDIEWLELYEFRPGAGPNVAALAVRLRPDVPLDAESLCDVLLQHRIHGRAYFAGRYRPRSLKSAGGTPNAETATKQVLCLPFWGRLTESDVSRVVDALTTAAALAPAGRSAAVAAHRW
jgi:dTDP-4-amino-4,6-dideoxygalactose transaminase